MSHNISKDNRREKNQGKEIQYCVCNHDYNDNTDCHNSSAVQVIDVSIL